MAKLIKNIDLYTGYKHMPDAYMRFTDTIEEVGYMVDFTARADDEVIDEATGQLVVPGFIDVHKHGGYGLDTMDGDPDKLNEMVNKMVTEGITSLFPTTMTQSPENIERALKTIDQVAKTNPVIQGIHLEGPFINKVFMGAQPEKYIIDPNTELLKKWYALSGERIRLVTYAPENGGLPDFEAFMLQHHIVPSIGHSNATREQLRHSRATHITHLYNAQRPLHHREPGVTGHGMLEESITGELIADGFHVVPDMLQLAFKVKGAQRLDLVTDSMRAEGLGNGESELGGQKVIVKDKQARLENGHLAGSVLAYDDAFANIQRFTSADISDAVQMSSVNQAREFGLTQKGDLSASKDADFNIFNQDMELQATYSLGRRFAREN
ncbi:N-acetylglucosamine-6-phosphate deacetylase [Leuconostoc falkenbergense]|jgi:N-acetylglucosamine-6-phosphate deacetylase|uniref:N-acetylglucosamine-6-phosphate deacetylase n=1 Tax=Leuconostoc falkenbergense TaxID=2766470 RepID=A0A9X3E875_9LACO|nr:MULTISPECIES: N-acetylglucosamine-6-phosphate deacetylase [Leuconostoc]RDG19981.1 N-acetylglucosamine-6-phosphate deacetylase [Leuconostoc pseudomesenteroides]MCT4390723.1 N-acetylglucosamine-6-phosphate deacetylase [Leuconostoc falkenbergense]MCT4410790.1 N-acetylglucosamine-6-phosphate deacetylase [Leuconostoc falkenbergense]MCX7578488.1 N-acetylglucosamine-6-phosphate deacetylase [Leuconostoc falkenbergense]MDM7646005.1 N-acetylglucosamine-6-phosphate deacetylase [Leuconostoc falkenberge